MPDKQSSQAGSDVPVDASPSTTKVVWPSVTGVQLEELLHGLLEAMRASSLTWRAGSTAGSPPATAAGIWRLSRRGVAQDDSY